MANINEVNNYSEWRLLMEKQQHEKERLVRIESDMTIVHREYRKAFRKWRQLKSLREQQLKRLMELIPNKMG